MNIFLTIAIFSIFGSYNCFSVVKRQVNDLCASSPCKNGGKCIQVSVSLIYCACIDGYTGSTCNIAPAITTTKAPSTSTTTVSPCVPGICKNDGVCKVFSGNLAFCECKNGFTGTFCEIPPTVQTTILPPSTTTTLSKLCSVNPCKNGATCTDLSDNLAYCQCPQGYGGTFCETSLGSSTISSASTTSSTTESSSSTTTTTSTSTTESSSSTTPTTTTTSTSTTESSSSTTPTTTTTTTSTTESSSTTTPITSTISSDSTTTTLESTTTTIQQEPCPNDSEICRNNGTCIITNGASISCNCPLPYSGVFCEIENKFCDLSPCKNGASCDSSLGKSGECVCINGFEGKTCNTKKCDPTNNPCKNSLTCYEIDEKFQCFCKVGFTGEFCDTPS